MLVDTMGHLLAATVTPPPPMSAPSLREELGAFIKDWRGRPHVRDWEAFDNSRPLINRRAFMDALSP